ncbi:MAG: ATP-dependent DNA helicase RecG [Treponema sp.]
MLIGDIQIPVSNIAGAGKATTAQLANLNVYTVGDLLQLWPRLWEDRSQYQSLAEWNRYHKLQVRVSIVAHEWFGFGRIRTLKLVVSDDTKTIAQLLCFNRPFLEKKFPVSARAVVYGSFTIKYGVLQSSAFDIEEEAQAKECILPIYPLTQGLTQTKLRKLIDKALKAYTQNIDSELPQDILETYRLPHKKWILFAMHKPTTMQQTQEARYALIFEEFFIYQSAIGLRSLQRRGTLPRSTITKSADTATPVPLYSPLQQKLINRIPFSLTADQQTVIYDINNDIESAYPAARLIQGDVGSGKTLIAFLACLKVLESGGQAAFMAPTELLARQHAENAARLLEPLGVRLAFLTGNLKAKGRSHLAQQLLAGNIDLIIGTHALFSRQTAYHNLRLVIIDEQHRFGVLQRSAIIQKGIDSNTEHRAPHFLMMSATPIPRTLALSMFGDLDISVIKTLPPGRKPILTYIAHQEKAERVYHFIEQEMNAGKQAYFVYPLIEDSEAISLKSAEQMFTQLRNRFPKHRLALIHSKIDEDEQRTIMEEFRNGGIHLLVATSVIEVGVDVPNATCMVIEHADRFGLSALHQLRGRIGRGDSQSYCFLLYGKNITDIGKQRLTIMGNTTDGFIIAEEDLKLRGPGDIGGTEQSGYCGFILADPIRDYAILEKARTAAFNTLECTYKPSSAASDDNR